jgi:predicted metal-dependent HD superfamily phosphohydrolase
MDLSIRGTPAPAFACYEADIRREYAMVPEDAYRVGRAAVLERFLSRDRLYSPTISTRASRRKPGAI